MRAMWIVGVGLALAGCKKSGASDDVVAPTPAAAIDAGVDLDAPPPLHATVTIAPASGSQVAGSIELIETADGVDFDVRLAGLAPGLHGIHVHELGDCSAADASSAGGHFNPASTSHGDPMAAMHHGGDLGNLTANADGDVAQTFTIHGVTLAPGPRSLFGRAIVVHAQVDDFTTQPSGNSGARVGCGVIELDADRAAPP